MSSPYRVKLVHVDRHAREKGFRAGQVYWVTDVDPTCNPKRGMAYLLYNWRTRKFEVFFMDQLRRKPLANERVPVYYRPTHSGGAQ